MFTGSKSCVRLIAIAIPNSREMPSTPPCLLDFRQCIDAVGSSSLLGLVFTNFNQLHINFIDSGIVKPDAYYPPLFNHVFMLFEISTCKCVYSNYVFAFQDHMLYNVLLTYDWSFMYKIISIDDVVASLNAVVQNAMVQAVPMVPSQSKIFIIDSLLLYSITFGKKKDYYCRHFKKKNLSCF
jgi:hypothetical protein